MKRKDNKNRVLEKGESQRKDGLYMYRYQDIFGKRQCIYNADLSKLRDEERKIRRDLEDGIRLDQAQRTVNEQVDFYLSLKTKLAHSTRLNYIQLWNAHGRNKWIGVKPIGLVKKSDILKFYTELKYEEGLSFSTIRIIHMCLAPSFGLAVDDDILRKNPCKDCLNEFENDAKTRNALTVKEQEEFLEFIRYHNTYSKYYPMFLFMLETGVRKGEMLGLTWKNVDWEEKTVTIDHQLRYLSFNGKMEFCIRPPKTESGIRQIPLTTLALNALKEQRKRQLQNGRIGIKEVCGYSDFIFTTGNQTPYLPCDINRFLENIVKSYNEIYYTKNDFKLPKISPHILRHTACTRMAESGMDIRVLQEIMGHSDISVTMKVYNHTSTERNRKEIEKFDKIRLLG